MEKKGLIRLFVTSITLISLGCNPFVNREDTAPVSEERSIPVVSLVSKDTTVYTEYIADIQAYKNVEIRSRLTGFLESIHVDEGSLVRRGQVMFRVNDEEYKAELAKAKALLSNAEADAKKIELELQRTKKLVEKEIVGQMEYELLQVQLKAAKAKVEEASALVRKSQTQLSFAQLRAPFDGRIDRIHLREGSLLSEGSLLTTISDLSRVNVYFDISEAEYLSLVRSDGFDRNKYRQEVKLILANGDEYPHKGMAEIVESEFETHTGSISLRAQFPNAKGVLSHGASGKVAVPVSTGQLLFVHQKSVFEIQDKTYVYVLQPDSTVRMTPFAAGQRIGHYYVVNSGIDPNEKVVFEGLQLLRDGMKVKAKDVSVGELD